MGFVIHAACVSDPGRVRRNNEDNCYFCGKHLPAVHGGTSEPLCCKGFLRRRVMMAVFDGMGGENFGAEAS